MISSIVVISTRDLWVVVSWLCIWCLVRGHYSSFCSRYLGQIFLVMSSMACLHSPCLCGFCSISVLILWFAFLFLVQYYCVYLAHKVVFCSFACDFNMLLTLFIWCAGVTSKKEKDNFCIWFTNKNSDFSLRCYRGFAEKEPRSLYGYLASFLGRKNIFLLKELCLMMFPFQNLWQLPMFPKVEVKVVIYNKFNVFLTNHLDTLLEVAIRSFEIFASSKVLSSLIVHTLPPIVHLMVVLYSNRWFNKWYSQLFHPWAFRVSQLMFLILVFLFLYILPYGRFFWILATYTPLIWHLENPNF